MGYSELFQAEPRRCALGRQSITSGPRALTFFQFRKTSPCWSPAVGCDTHRTRKPSICMLRCPCALDPPHGRPCPQVWSGGRLAGPRCRSPHPRHRGGRALHTTNRRRALGVRLCYFPFFSHRHTIRSLERGCHARPFFLVRLAPPYPCFTRVGGGAISSKLQVASRKSQVARSK